MLVAGVTAAMVRKNWGGVKTPPPQIQPVQPAPPISILLDVSGAVGEEVHEAGVEVGFCRGGKWGHGGQNPSMGWGGLEGAGGCGILLTCEVEEGVEDVEAFHVIPLDELVGVIVEDFSPGEGPMELQPKLRVCPPPRCVSVSPPGLGGPQTHPLRKRNPWAQTSRFP